MKIVCDSAVYEAQRHFSTYQDAEHELVLLDASKITAEALTDADALVVRSVTKVNHELLKLAEKLEFVGTATIGHDHVDTELLAKLQVRFATAKGCSRVTVAQYVLRVIAELRPQFFEAGSAPTLGVVGVGNIGKCVARYGELLGWNVVVCDPFEVTHFDHLSLSELLGCADVISLHVPLTTHQTSSQPTLNFIGLDQLELIQDGCLLINSSRGPVVNEAALIEATKNGLSAALDVFASEPKVSAELLELLELATPHVAGYSSNAKALATKLIAQALFEPESEDAELEEAKLYLPEQPLSFMKDWYPIRADQRALLDTVDPELGATQAKAFETLRTKYPLRSDWFDPEHA